MFSCKKKKKKNIEMLCCSVKVNPIHQAAECAWTCLVCNVSALWLHGSIQLQRNIRSFPSFPLYVSQMATRATTSQCHASFSPFRSLFHILLLALISIAMAETAPKPIDSSASSAPAVHIVYTEQPQDEQPEAYHIRTLSAVLGSEEAAKEALLYSYKSAASGFSAKLTPQQVAEISKQPGVLQVVPNRKLELHSGESGGIGLH